MHKLFYLICFVHASICIHYANGEHPLQTLLSTLECYKSTQEGCNTDFTDAYPELSMSFNNLSTAATRFYLFTPNNVDDPELLHKCAGTTPPNTKFNRNCKTFIAFPGFVSGICHLAIYKEVLYQRMKCGCYNYIHVEWTWGNSFDLDTAVQNQKIVAKQLAVVIRNLKEKYGLTADDFHCMGHSLGAHGCGLAAQEEPIGRIDGVEPAGGPYYESMPLDERLDPGDAPCVQATHCNAGQCIPAYFGVNFTIGTKDFWFNDGLHQIGCYRQMLISFLKGDLFYAIVSLLPAACHHFQCLQHYRTSMCSPDCRFAAVECESVADFMSGTCNRDCGTNGGRCDITGFHSCECNKGYHKNYFLNAKCECPYCADELIINSERACPQVDTNN